MRSSWGEKMTLRTWVYFIFLHSGISCNEGVKNATDRQRNKCILFDSRIFPPMAFQSSYDYVYSLAIQKHKKEIC